jgi:hypothetical protein
MYYSLGRRLTNESVVIDPTSHEEYTLWDGARLDPSVPTPWTFEIDTKISGTEMPSLFMNETLFIKELYQAFVAAGVDNLETYPAVIINPDTGAEHHNYLVVNVIGLVACADMQASQYAELADSYVFRQLVIHPERTGGALMFRLAESPPRILISDQVVSKLPRERFPDMVLTEVLETPSP